MGVISPEDWERRRRVADDIATSMWEGRPEARLISESMSRKWCRNGESWLFVVVDDRYLLCEDRWESRLGVSYGVNTTPHRRGMLAPTLRGGNMVFGLQNFASSGTSIYLVDQWLDSYPAEEYRSLSEAETAGRAVLASIDDRQYGILVSEVGTSGPLRRTAIADLSSLSFGHDYELD